MYKVICLLIVVSILGIGSCKKETSDPSYCGTAWSVQLSTQITALANAASLYSSSPTLANCNSYKTAYQNYLDALKPFAKCTLYTPAQKTELENSIAEAEADISTLCN